MFSIASRLSWRTRRQLAYLAIPIIPTLLIGGYLIFNFYTTATCYDGKINQGEQGIDCEGPCPKVCSARIAEPEILFSDAYSTNPGTYNLAAMIENRNSDLGIKGAQVTMTAFDDEGLQIYQDITSFDIRPAATSMAFIGPVKIDKTPTRVETTIDYDNSSWQLFGPDEAIPEPAIINSEIIGGKTSNPKVTGVIQNLSRKNVIDMPVGVVVRGEKQEIIAVSNTLVDIAPESSSELIYTWPGAFPTTTGVCMKPVDVMLAIDASGSMNSISIDPPEPLTSVKTAAKRFTGLFSNSDNLGVVSFANNGMLMQSLTTSIDERINGINAVVITSEAENGYTNIADALLISNQSLQSVAGNGRGKAVIILTDGLPTAPDGQPDPELTAIAQANALRQNGVNIFVIGLGDRLNQTFLASLVGGNTDRVFQTSNVDELGTIYSQIATAVCERAAYQVQLYPNPPIL